MKRIYLLLILIFLLSACDRKNDEADLTSGPTSKYDKVQVGTTKADEQFAKLKKKNGKGENKIIKTVRPEVARFVEEQFKQENIIDKDLDKLQYKINKKAISTSFDDDAKHIFRNIGFDYYINLKKLEKSYSLDDFINENKKKDDKLKIVEMKAYDKVLVENIGNDSFSAKLIALYKKGESSYSLTFSSEKMSIAEIIMLSEKFSEFIK